MIRKIKKIFFGKATVEIRTAKTKDNEDISYFRVLHPFLTRKEVVNLMAKYHEFNKDKGAKHRLVFEEKPTLLQSIKKFIKK